ncbi:MAG: SH3 domain-containing protein [Anaerolineae bacterium]|nr:SH3 domain-containing protein [Anaerolineae bacterium]
MNNLKRLWIGLVLVLMLSLGMSASAQDVDGTLAANEPVSVEIAQAGQSFRFAYTLNEARVVSLQALGIDVAPVLAILRDGQTVAADLNAGALPILNLDVFLDAGSYVVQVSAGGAGTGTVVLLVQRETPAAVTPLATGGTVGAEVSQAVPVVIYSFAAATEPLFLYVESGLPDRGPSVRLTDDATGEMSGSLSAALAGGRFRIPAGASTYQLELSHGGGDTAVPFTVCLTTVSASGCESFTGLVAPVVTEEPVAICTVTPEAGSVNVRQSASVNAIILGTLPAGVAAPVIGISPDGAFWFIEVGGVQGWVATSVVFSNGNCNVSFVSPPPVTPQPSAPTPTPLPFPTAASQPTAPSPVTTPEPTGPCLITVTAPMYTYTTPNANQETIYDQAQAGYQFIPSGRLADNTWWRLGDGSAWIQTSSFGVTATVTGDCSGLPIVEV